MLSMRVVAQKLGISTMDCLVVEDVAVPCNYYNRLRKKERPRCRHLLTIKADMMHLCIEQNIIRIQSARFYFQCC